MITLFNSNAVKFLNWILSLKKGFIVLNNKNAERSIFFNLWQETKKEVDFLLNYYESYQLYVLVKRTSEVSGEIAEVGAYMGGSSKILAEAEKNKPIHIFDTFEGLPPVNKKVDGTFSTGDFNAQIYTDDLFSFVKNYLKKYPNVFLYKGIFPETGAVIQDRQFSFVHLDVDIYESTLQALQFFYSRLSPGGIIVSHDYENGPGVKKAFDEFFSNKPETIIPLIAGQQCLIIKAKH